jgi:hypothetical protein
MNIGYFDEKASRKETTRKTKKWVDNIKMDLKVIG